MKYSTSDFKNGLKILVNNEPYIIIENEFEKPGKGQAFTRLKLRNLLNQRTLEKTYKSGQSVARADVIEKTMTFLYKDTQGFHFMDQENYEQITIDTDRVGESARWLLEQDPCHILFWNDVATSVRTESFITTTIQQCEPGIKGDTVSGGSKVATISTGAEIKVPLFIKTNDRVKIDTRDGSYVSRV